jgi:hypothetical protein
MHVSVDTYSIATLWWDGMHDSWSCASLEEVLYLDARGPYPVGILKSEEFIEITTNTPFSKIPGGAGRNSLMKKRLTKD